MRFHRTVAAPVEISGIGVHSGAAATVRVSPRRAEGIVLRRAGAGGAEIRAGLASVTGDARRTSLGDVATVEHLLASAYALGLSALEIEIDGPEVPIADGSAAPFFDALAAAGADDLPGAQPVIRVTEPVWVRDGDRFAAALPRQLAADGGNGAPGLRLTYQVGLRGRGDQAFDVDLTPGAFRARVASARTWGYLEDVDALRTAELARGASLENTLVIDGGAYRNPPRGDDEPVRHKLVDLVGDLALLEARLTAHVICVRGGHALHLALARAIAARFAPEPAGDHGARDGGARRIGDEDREA